MNPPPAVSGQPRLCRPRLSVIIITRNEAAHIVACLESVAFADEFIVVDSGSTDNTVELARAMGAVVEQTADWPGFGPQKNRALALAEGEWVLSIDADERVTPELAEEIQRVIAADGPDTYEMPRLSNFCGRFIRHSGWWPDYVLRLFRRGSARFTDAPVHEKAVSASGARWQTEPASAALSLSRPRRLDRQKQPLFVRRRDDDVCARQAHHHLWRHGACGVDFHPYLSDPARVPRWTARVGAGGQCRGRQFLPVRQADVPGGGRAAAFEAPQVRGKP